MAWHGMAWCGRYRKEGIDLSCVIREGKQEDLRAWGEVGVQYIGYL